VEEDITEMVAVVVEDITEVETMVVEDITEMVAVVVWHLQRRKWLWCSILQKW
jgi:hypothetical protein